MNEMLDKADYGWVCLKCDALSSFADKVCTSCSAPRPDIPLAPAVEVAAGAKTTGAAAVEAEPDRTCTVCGVESPASSKFCIGCGAAFDTESCSVAPGRAVLVSVRGGSGEPAVLEIKNPGVTLGYGDVELRFRNDPFLEPRHARIYYREGRLLLRDEGTLNGTYVRLGSTLKLQSGDMFICGAQLFRYVEQTQRFPSDRAVVRLLTSPTRSTPFRIEHVLRGGQLGAVAFARAGRVIVGRSGSDLNFNHDLYLSGQHACVEKLTSTATVLMDLNSKNGTFRRVRGPEVLSPGDLVFVGRQLFRVEFTHR